MRDSVKCERCKTGLCKVRSAPPGRISHTSSVTAHTRHYKAGEKLGRSLDFLLRLLCVAFLFSTFMFFLFFFSSFWLSVITQRSPGESGGCDTRVKQNEDKKNVSALCFTL